MMSKKAVLASQEARIRTILDIFAQTSRLPIGIYEKQNGESVGIFASDNPSLYEEHCRYIQSLPGGKAKCVADEKRRAKEVREKGEEGLSICHAGIYNYAVPVALDDEVKAVILYGELRLAEASHEKISLEKHAEAVSNLGLDAEQAQTLKRLLAKVKDYSEDEFAHLQATLPQVAEWLYRIFDDEEKARYHIEKITHEIQTRIQGILNAENLLTEFDELKKYDLKMGIHGIINSAEALATVVNNLGKFQREYRFYRQRIETLLIESKRIYEAEAKRKGIEIKFDLRPVDGNDAHVELSRDHLQLAFNNLIHNAIKYSFRGAPGRERFVKVRGRQEGHLYSLAIENYGVGILPEEIAEGLIFDENYQGKLTDGEFRTGSGKGLFFVKQVLKEHHGTISAFCEQKSQGDSPEGQPHLVRFIIKLPFQQPAR
ncbi:MAG: GHKL domain-containing protein [Anaerolineae bacterium]|jgi:signal transduction histidine kinase|nr:GHKL domain-containing protein [Anaerolineae bacterium]MBT7070781.1 GHKL domain-containing protein [Anaerolineae bacterium]MBT7325025.1 GHKL domain-containing protein [Anaerolineae bacterium]